MSKEGDYEGGTALFLWICFKWVCIGLWGVVTRQRARSLKRAREGAL